jgi:hypothetical protein
MYQITDNFFIHGDDLKIVNFLADLGVKLDDESNRVLTFFQNGNFYLVFYFSKDGDRGFIMYEVLEILDNLHELIEVKSVLVKQLESGNNINVLKSAIGQIEFIQMAGKAAELFK